MKMLLVLGPSCVLPYAALIAAAMDRDIAAHVSLLIFIAFGAREMTSEENGIARSRKKASMQVGKSVVVVMSSGTIFITNAIIATHRSTRLREVSTLLSALSLRLGSLVRQSDSIASSAATTSGAMSLPLCSGPLSSVVANVKNASKKPRKGRETIGLMVCKKPRFSSNDGLWILAVAP